MKRQRLKPMLAHIEDTDTGETSDWVPLPARADLAQVISDSVYAHTGRRVGEMAVHVADDVIGFLCGEQS